jgi:hypothetical protein
MAAFCDARYYHILEWFHAYRALNIICIDHIEDDRNDILPFNILILIIEV